MVVDRQGRYENAKAELLADKAICKQNRDFWREFFEMQEYKLKRTNNLNALDAGTYKTLYYYVIRFRNLNDWFVNKPWRDLTREDIKRVYDGLEDGTITNQSGKRFKSREDYYSKIMKSKAFEMVGKAELAREVIQFARPNRTEVRFILEEDFRKLVQHASKLPHRLLLWLAWDIGENINSLLQLRKQDFFRGKNPDTDEPEYRVNLRNDILKRTRKARSELTNYPETVELLDAYLADLAPDEALFPYGYHNAKKMLDRVREKAKVKCMPNGEIVTWKDFRSGMACDLLKKGWTTDEVNARLGHKPSSEEIDKYVNFLAIDRHRPKRKVEAFKTKEMERELKQFQEREKLQSMRTVELQEKMAKMEKVMEAMMTDFIESGKADKIHKEYQKAAHR